MHRRRANPHCSDREGTDVGPHPAPPPDRIWERRKGHVAYRLDAAQLRRRLVIADAVTITIGLTAAFVVQSWIRPTSGATISKQILLACAAVPMWLGANHAMKLYRARANLRFRVEAQNILRASLLATGVIIVVGFFVAFETLSRLWVGLVFLSTTGAMVLERRVASRMFQRARRERRIARRVLIVGSDAYATQLSRELLHSPALGYEPCGFVGNVEAGRRAGIDMLGGLDEIEEIAHHAGVNGVMISLFSTEAKDLNHLCRRLTDAGLHVTLSSSLRDIEVRRLLVHEIDGQAMIYVEPTVRTGWRRVVKMGIDKTMAAIGLLISLPVLVGAAIAIKLDSRGPVLFRQERVGQHGVPFEILKLRTMATDAEARRGELQEHNESDGPLFKMSNDPRITRVGRVLRRLSIDELPQFWNVIRGDMSVVGPRPALESEVEDWTEELHDRLRVLPGITGMWQVSGRADTSFEEYKRLDLYYVDNWSLIHDVRIVWRTLGAVLRRSGAR